MFSYLVGVEDREADRRRIQANHKHPDSILFIIT